MKAVLARRRSGTPRGVVFFAGPIEVVSDDTCSAFAVSCTTAMFDDDALVFPSFEEAQAVADFLNPRLVAGEAFHVFPWVSFPSPVAPQAADGAGATEQAPETGGSGADDLDLLQEVTETSNIEGALDIAQRAAVSAAREELKTMDFNHVRKVIGGQS